MQSIYNNYKCKSCKREMILITDEVDGAIKQGKYLACAYCGSKRLIKVWETSEFKKLFKNDEKKR